MWSKRCPKCNSPIEKNGGCPHMTCASCNHEFCWHCMQNYHGHVGSICSIISLYRYGIVFMLFILLLVKISYDNQIMIQILLLLFKPIGYFAIAFVCFQIVFWNIMWLVQTLAPRYQNHQNICQKVLLFFYSMLSLGVISTVIYNYWFLMYLLYVLLILGVPAFTTFIVSFPLYSN